MIIKLLNDLQWTKLFDQKIAHKDG